MPTTEPVAYCAREGCYNHARLDVTTADGPTEALCEPHARRAVDALKWAPDTTLTLRAIRSTP